MDSCEHGFGNSIFQGLDEDGICISCPPPERDKLYRLFAKYRVVAENRIADCRDWMVCKLPLRARVTKTLQILDLHQKYWTIVAAFVNDFR